MTNSRYRAYVEQNLSIHLWTHINTSQMNLIQRLHQDDWIRNSWRRSVYTRLDQIVGKSENLDKTSNHLLKFHVYKKTFFLFEYQSKSYKHLQPPARTLRNNPFTTNVWDSIPKPQKKISEWKLPTCQYKASLCVRTRWRGRDTYGCPLHAEVSWTSW